jgi:hypothetical protein
MTVFWLLRDASLVVVCADATTAERLLPAARERWSLQPQTLEMTPPCMTRPSSDEFAQPASELVREDVIDTLLRRVSETRAHGTRMRGIG